MAFRDGGFMTEDYSYVKGKFYDNDTGEVMEEPTDKMKERKEQVHYELSLNDEVLNGDLLRFYEPNEDWEPVDPGDYQYGKSEEEDENN